MEETRLELAKDPNTHIFLRGGVWYDADGVGIPPEKLNAIMTYVRENETPSFTMGEPAKGVAGQLSDLAASPSQETPPKTRARPTPGSDQYYTDSQAARQRLIDTRLSAYHSLKAAKDLYDSSQPGGIKTLHPKESMPPARRGAGGIKTELVPALWDRLRGNSPEPLRQTWATEALRSPQLKPESEAFTNAHKALVTFDEAHPDLLQMINPESGYPDEFEGRLSDEDAHYRRAKWEASK
mgnify:CR=1 FL=1|tara:strand:+ start:73 stop:789 length:717 start_codon:yes stop_codon:yes gene_type:complete